VVVAWIVVVAGLGWWSVRRDRATVPDQRDIAVAVDDLRRATGALFAAAGGDERAAVLGPLELVRDCRITPVRRGMIANRDVTVHVHAGEALAALDAIAAGLPADYRAYVAERRGGTRLAFYADAGNFVGIDSDAESTARVVTLRVTTGCRPRGDAEPDRADPVAGAAPRVLDTVVAGLGGAASAPTSVQAVACPDGGVAATYSVDGMAAPADLAARMRVVSAGASVVRDDAAAWAYRAGDDAVVVVPDGQRLRVSVSAGC
jgi:hypothetical protein